MTAAAWRRYLGYYRDSRRVLLALVAVAVGQGFLLFPIGLLFRYMFDTVIPERDVVRLVLAGCATVLLYISSDGLTIAVRFVTLRITKQVTRRIRDDLVNKVYTFPRDLSSHTDTSKLHASIVQDSERVDVMSNLGLAQLLPAVVSALVIGGALFVLNRFLFVVMLAIGPLLVVMNRGMGARVRAEVQAYNTSFQVFSKGILFVLQMLDLTRTQSAERFETGRQSGIIEELRVASEVMSRYQVLYVSMHRIIILASSVIVLSVGGLLVSWNAMTLGELIAFYVVSSIAKDYLLAITSALPQVIAGRESVVNLHQILSMEEHTPYSGTRRIDFRGKLAFQAVDFRYETHPTLQGVTLTIEPGTTVALIGPNGAGKSTFVNLALGLYRPQAGRLCADDRPYDELDMTDLRRQMGVVPQDPIILPGSIAENISYGSPDATREQIAAAARIAAADEFIQTFDAGYDTFVGENGVLLSGGQRQSVAIARAVLRRPPMLILDEPTNHLDHGVIQQLMRNLRELDYAPATILISHNREIVREAQQVYYMKDGRISASGEPTAFLQESRESNYLLEGEA
ncbi:MAG: ABC transporter ATP-binding protein/permease [Chloroflexi bacterium]|nr:ABC transporter ATP-binding protein/permease [Chloroflexota bacterium]